MTEAKTVAFVSYNKFSDREDGEHNVKGRLAILLQSPDKKWAAGGDEKAVIGDDIGDPNRERADVLVGFSDRLEQVHGADHVVLYVGAGVSRMDMLAPFLSGRSADQLTLVMCDCSLDRKVQWCRDEGFDGAHIIECQCGGHEKMSLLLENFLKTGAVFGHWELYHRD
ncbi:hypothetical protein HOI83_01625 [Candidatus Uhrbacteria bacterium]|jgi:hypothetical protein|nr:hypothetical protein [Candidatus Uhrbacteria bacterium]